MCTKLERILKERNEARNCTFITVFSNYDSPVNSGERTCGRDLLEAMGFYIYHATAAFGPSVLPRLWVLRVASFPFQCHNAQYVVKDVL
jgi:hypothetical protein